VAVEVAVGQHVIDGATTDPRLELHAGRWSAKYVPVGVPPAADADREYLEGGRRPCCFNNALRNAALPLRALPERCFPADS